MYQEFISFEHVIFHKINFILFTFHRARLAGRPRYPHCSAPTNPLISSTLSYGLFQRAGSCVYAVNDMFTNPASKVVHHLLQTVVCVCGGKRYDTVALDTAPAEGMERNKNKCWSVEYLKSHLAIAVSV